MSEAAPNATGNRLAITWIDELPFTLVLLLTIAGVAYTGISRQPVVIYWEILAPVIGVLCVVAGWPHAPDQAGHVRLVATQILHWSAFLVVMNLVLLPSVQRNFTANSTGIAIVTLLALGTFTAGLAVLSWRVCLLGLILALGIPAIAWVEDSSLLFVLIVIGVVTIVIVFSWHWHKSRKGKATLTL
jgi:hypothetical protein